MKYETEKIEVRAYTDDVARIWDSIEQAIKAINIIKEWWEKNECKQNKIMTIKNIKKTTLKVSLINNSLKFQK